MKLISKLALVLVMGSASVSFATSNSISLRCTGANNQDCVTRTTEALTKMSCAPTGVDCQLQREVDGNGNPTGEAVYCEAKSEKCSEAKPYLFGGVYCNGNESKTSLAKYDNKLSLSYSTGLFRAWVRTICVAP